MTARSLLASVLLLLGTGLCSSVVIMDTPVCMLMYTNLLLCHVLTNSMHEVTMLPGISEALTPSSTCSSLVSSWLITTKSSLSARSVAQYDTVWRNCKGSWYDWCERKSGRWAGWCTVGLIRFCVFNVDFDVWIISYLVFYFSVFVRMFSYLVWFMFFLGFSDKTL